MKKLVLFLLAIALVLSFAGCSSIAGLFNNDFDASLYVQGKLDVIYTGQASDKYFEILDGGGKDSAASQYEEMMEYQYEYLAYYYLDIYTEYLSEETAALGQNVVKDIYLKANYEVASALKAGDGSYNVNVTVTPLSILDAFFDNYYDDIYDEYYEKYYEAFSEEMSDEDYEILFAESEDFYAKLMFAKLSEMVANNEITYEDPEVIVVRVYEESTDLFTVSDTDLASIDSIIMYTPA